MFENGRNCYYLKEIYLVFEQKRWRTKRKKRKGFKVFVLFGQIYAKLA